MSTDISLRLSDLSAKYDDLKFQVESLTTSFLQMEERALQGQRADLSWRVEPSDGCSISELIPLKYQEAVQDQLWSALSQSPNASSN